MGAKSARKGAAGERELAAILREHGYPVERGGSLSFGEVPGLSGLPGVHIECKRRETAEIWKWMVQAEADAERFRDGAPAVFFRRSRSPWMVCMKLSDWLILYDRQKTAKSGEEVHYDTETAKGASDIPQQGSSGKGGGYCPPHT